VRRHIEVPLAIRLDRLHQVFQAVMGWENYGIRAQMGSAASIALSINLDRLCSRSLNLKPSNQITDAEYEDVQVEEPAPAERLTRPT
jgi:hypothetical protein